MSAPRVIPDKACAECGTLFRPHSWKQFHNPDACHNRRCASKRMYRRGRCARMVAGSLTARRARKRRDVERMVGRRYGELSVREIELFNLGMKIGFDRGYGKAWKRVQRAGVAA